MKIINSSRNINVDELYDYLQSKLNFLFHIQKQSDITFNLVKDGQTIEINQPQLYDGFLFRLHAEGNRLEVARSEHYVDDINVITLESILDILFAEHLGTTAPQL